MPEAGCRIAGVPAHAAPLREVLAALGVGSGGLRAAEAEERLVRCGPNRPPRAAAVRWWRIALRQFASPLVVVLAIAAAISLGIGHATDAGFIMVVLVLNSLIGGFQEWRAERSAEGLQSLLRFRSCVERDGELVDIDAESIVPGDVVWLESGARVPADGRLLDATGLAIDESLLTGESLSVAKDEEWIGPLDAPLAERINMVHAGTLVVRGRGRAVVTATGAASAVGRLAIDMLAAPAGRPPLLVRLDRFSRSVGIGAIIAAALVAVLGVVVHGHPVWTMGIFAVALAVSVIPEGLPVAITIALAVASRRMARRGVIVRRLGAVEGLGSCTLIASDKTGTLTCNEITARSIRLPDGRHVAVEGEGFAPAGRILGGKPDAALLELLRAGVWCNEADLHERGATWTWRGDPTDVALLALGRKAGIARATELDRHAEVNRIPFEPERRFAASFHRVEGGVRVAVKGAPERVLGMCADGAEALGRAVAGAHAMASEGMRVLALAEGEAAPGIDPTMVPPEPRGLRFLGLVGMIDPLRPRVREAVEACQRAGIGVCMITGDHPTTALAIAAGLGLPATAEQVVTGTAVDAMSDRELVAGLGDPLRGVPPAIRVFSRVTPEQKLRIVEAARAAGHFVAVTGDGANDAPALRAASIGVAMGRGGTDVARDASDLVITDDNFATIVNGVVEGRVAYDNIRKVIYLLVSTNGAEVLMAVVAVAIGLPLPLLPVQLLWLNLVTEGMQHVALAFERAEDDVLARRPRRPTEPIFDRLMVERLAVGSAVIGGVSLAAFAWMLQAGWSVEDARNALLLLMVLFENVQVGNSRSETRSLFAIPPWRNPLLLAATAGSFAVHLVAMHWGPLRSVLATSPVSAPTWLALGGLALTVVVAMEAYKIRHALAHSGQTVWPLSGRGGTSRMR